MGYVMGYVPRFLMGDLHALTDGRDPDEYLFANAKGGSASRHGPKKSGIPPSPPRESRRGRIGGSPCMRSATRTRAWRSPRAAIRRRCRPSSATPARRSHWTCTRNCGRTAWTRSPTRSWRNSSHSPLRCPQNVPQPCRQVSETTPERWKQAVPGTSRKTDINNG